MNSRQRRTLRRRLLRTVKTYARAEATRLGLDPEKAEQYTLDYTPVAKLMRQIAILGGRR